MYTGYNPPPRKSHFAPVLILCTVLILALAVAVGLMADYYDVALVEDAHGRLSLSMTGQAIRQPSVTTPSARIDDPLVVVDIPRQSSAMVTDSSGRQVLSGNEVYKKVVPSVVGIISRYSDADEASSGTGIIVTADGYIATNNHVVIGASSVTVIFSSGEEISARIVGLDSRTDLAVLKIDRTGLTPAELGNSDELEPGDDAYVIGNPLGLELQNTITDGMISAINRDISFSEYAGDVRMTVIQTNCAVNPGNSGGPLCNVYGQVVGIISSKIMGDVYQSIEGLGFAIPVSVAQPILGQLISDGYVHGRPAIGITSDATKQIDERTARYYGLPTGVLIETVNPASDAYAKGVKAGDIVTKVNGQEVTTVADINNIKQDYAVGDSLSLTIYREGRTFDVDVTLVEEGTLK